VDVDTAEIVVRFYCPDDIRTCFRDEIGTPPDSLDLRIRAQKPVESDWEPRRLLELTANSFDMVERRSRTFPSFLRIDLGATVGLDVDDENYRAAIGALARCLVRIILKR
jgi:hypothetical protein